MTELVNIVTYTYVYLMIWIDRWKESSIQLHQVSGKSFPLADDVGQSIVNCLLIFLSRSLTGCLILLLLAIFSRRGLRPIGRFTTTYRGPAAISADRFRIAGFSGRLGSLFRLSLQHHHLFHLHRRRQRSGDSIVLAISRWRSIVSILVGIVDYFISQSR